MDDKFDIELNTISEEYANSVKYKQPVKLVIDNNTIDGVIVNTTVIGGNQFVLVRCSDMPTDKEVINSNEYLSESAIF